MYMPMAQVHDMFHGSVNSAPCSPIDSTVRLMTVWRITGEIREQCHYVRPNYICARIMEFLQL